MKTRRTKYRSKSGDALPDLNGLRERFPDAMAWLDAHGPVTYLGSGAARMVFRLHGGKTVAKLEYVNGYGLPRYNLREYKAYKEKFLPMAACRPILGGRILLMRSVRFPGRVERPPTSQLYNYFSAFGGGFISEPLHPPLVYPSTRFAEWASKITDWAQGGYTLTKPRRLVCYDASHEFQIPLS